MKIDRELDKRLREEAWVGDAVLALFAREFLLEKHGEIAGDEFIEFTSNDFLRLRGRPTEVEAQIGRLYKSDGLEGAYAWIEQILLPEFQHQQKIKARQRIPSKKRKK